MKQILLFLIVTNILMADFSRNGEIVTDTNTNLQWQDNTTPNTTPNAMTWKSAITYCENLTLGGYSDWRLPNKKELQSILDRSVYNPSISSVFQNTAPGYYWSSTTNSDYTDGAWIVYFYRGSSSYGTKYGSAYVRCVRGGH